MRILNFRINFIYILLIPFIWFIFQLDKNWNNESLLFYGFAENKETEINLDKNILVGKIHVTTGEEVVQGQLIMEVHQTEINLKINDANLDIQRINESSIQERRRLEDKIDQLEAQKLKKKVYAQNAIEQLETTSALNRSLLNDLQSIDMITSHKSVSETDMERRHIEQKLSEEIKYIELQIKQERASLASLTKPSDIIKKQIEKKINYHEKEQKKLKIYAPSDGLIGNIHCKEGEYFDAFSTLLSFYERNPTLVKGFVHENMILKVKVGDKLHVTSSLHRNHHIKGNVMGLGSRIVEIPERLRKIPEFKTYGREVLISIPANNPFLQKEKVLLTSNPIQDNVAGISYISLPVFFPGRDNSSNGTETTFLSN